MAFKMIPGRSPFMKTGHGIPAPFMQVKTNAGTGEDLSAQARAQAEAKAKEKLAALGENTGTSKDVRNVEATATVTREGKKVEKFAKTKAEIEAWKAAPKENKEKYLNKSATETVKLSDVGKDKPVTPSVPTEEPKNYGMWHRNITGSNNNGFGGHSSTGRLDTSNTEDAKFIEASQLKDYTDKYQGKDVINNNIASSSKNSFELKPVTAEEDRVGRFLRSGVVSPYDSTWKDKKNENPGSGETRRQDWLKGRVDYINQKDTEAKSRLDLKNQKIAEAKQKAEEFKNSRAKKPAPVAMQLKRKAKSPAMQMKSKKTSAAKMKKC